jgi:two-component system CheB/CheR fusion protein
MQLHGDALTLQPKHALALSMAIHELATNAAKYGALSVKTGQITIGWTTRKTRKGLRLHLQWVESDGPAVKPPVHRGFGTRLISEGLPYELDGQVTLAFLPHGVTCVIDVPLFNGTS